MRKLTSAVCAAFAAVLAMSALPARAQQYPNQDVHIICAFPAGSGADVLVRYMAEKLRPLMGRAPIVENRVGAGGNIATEYVARAKPDGYTVYIHGGSGVIASVAVLRHPSFDLAKSIRVVATINRQSTMFVVHVNKPWTSVPEVTAAMKAKGEKATYATSNPIGKVMGALYKKYAGLNAVEVSYRTAADSLNDLANGAVDYAMFDNVFSSAQAREGRLRILALGTEQRIDANPGIPTLKELGYPINLPSYFTVMVPMGTPEPIVRQLNAWTNQILATEESKKFLAESASDPWISTPEAAEAFFLQDIKNWQEYVRVANIEPQD